MKLSTEALVKVIFVTLSEAKDLDSSVACGSLRMTDIRYLQEAQLVTFVSLFHLKAKLV
jgi:hypothetical protein